MSLTGEYIKALEDRVEAERERAKQAEARLMDEATKTGIRLGDLAAERDAEREQADRYRRILIHAANVAQVRAEDFARELRDAVAADDEARR